MLFFLTVPRDSKPYPGWIIFLQYGGKGVQMPPPPATSQPPHKPSRNFLLNTMLIIIFISYS